MHFGGFFCAGDGGFQVAEEAVFQAIDPAVDGEFLASLPCVAGNGGLADVGDLFDDVEFAEAVGGLGFTLLGGEAAGVFFAHILDVAEPVVAEADSVVAQCCADAAAPVVTAHDDVAHFEDIYGKLHDGKAVQVGVDDDVCDVAVDEEFAGEEVHDFVGGDAAVGAADPQVAGRLLVSEFFKKIRVLLPDALGPCPIFFKEIAECFHRCTAENRAVKWPTAVDN